MEIERRTTIADTEVCYVIEYLQLVVDNPDIIDSKYPKEVGYKVLGHIISIIEQLEEGKK